MTWRRILAIGCLALMIDWAPVLPPYPVPMAAAQPPGFFNPISATVLSAQATTTSPTALCSGGQAPPCVMDSSQTSVITIQVSTSAFTGTVNFDGSNDRTNWNALTCYTLDSATAVSSATAAGMWRCNVGGIGAVRVRVSSISGGTVTATINGVMSGLGVRDQASSSVSNIVSGAIRGSQTTAPTCQPAKGDGTAGSATNACTVIGTDSFMRGTIGTEWPSGSATLSSQVMVITFGTAYATTPSCVAIYDSTGTSTKGGYGYYIYGVTPTTTTVNIKLGRASFAALTPTAVTWTAGDAFNVICTGTS